MITYNQNKEKRRQTVKLAFSSQIKEIDSFAINTLGIPVPSSAAEGWWNSLGLEGFDLERVMTRLEAAVLIDDLFKLFFIADIDYQGNIKG